MSEPFRYRADGVFFCASEKQPGYEPKRPFRHARYSHLRVGCRVFIPENTNKRKLVLFAGRNGVRGGNPTQNLFCLAVLKRGKVVVRHGPRTPRGWKARGKIVCSGRVSPGWHEVSLSYKVRGKESDVVFRMVSEEGHGTVVGTGGGKASTLNFGDCELGVGFGFGSEHGVPAQVGWKWSDLFVEMD